jgi:hypothetical protein
VAQFFDEFTKTLAALGVSVRIHPMPVEVANPIRCDLDTVHRSYDSDAVTRFWHTLRIADTLLKRFSTNFYGKISPVHFFWGSFDLAVTRFSGRLCTPRVKQDPIMSEAYSHEVISCGFWPGGRRFKHPAFYSYTLPAPPGIDKEAFWEAGLGEFILKYEAIRAAEAPERAILDFCQSTYEAGAKLAQWDRQALECP